jgi:hypothetical protein
VKTLKNVSIDKQNEFIYILVIFLSKDTGMAISEHIRVLYASVNLSMTESARRTDQSPQSLIAKMRRESFTISELEQIAKEAGTIFEHKSVSAGGDQI